MGLLKRNIPPYDTFLFHSAARPNTAMLKIPAWQATRALLTRIRTAEMRSAQVAPVVAEESRVEKLSAATRVVDPQDFQIRQKAAQGG
jgi:hypothetical protein